MKHGSQITRYRQENDRMTLEEFGRLFTPPVDKSTVSRWERGQVSPKRAIEIEHVTGIKRHLLLPELFGSPEASQ